VVFFAKKVRPRDFFEDIATGEQLHTMKRVMKSILPCNGQPEMEKMYWYG
jgi:hypothetical protein